MGQYLTLADETAHMSGAVDELIATFEREARADRDPEEVPEIGIVMGSDSDLDVMAGAYDALTTLGFAELTTFDDPPEARFAFETYVISAHRTPELMFAYADTAIARGLDIIIAGAGGKSADLPNMTASIAYPLPVIGVPVHEKSVDSVIGMPTGAPIVAVDAGKSFNAALAAVQFLAGAYPELREPLESYHASLREDVGQTSQRLHTAGTERYRYDIGR